MLEALKPGYVLTGDATGVDEATRDWCMATGTRFLVAPAAWDSHLRLRAGPFRNETMARVGAAILARLMAFPGGKGTASMVREARAKNIQVFRPEDLYRS